MKLRTRFVALSASAVAAAVLVASGVVFFVVRAELRDQVDEGLQDLAGEAQVDLGTGGVVRVAIPAPPLGRAPGFAEVVTVGEGFEPAAPRILPVSSRDREIAEGRAGPHFRDVRVAGFHLRMLTTPIAPGVALQVARSLDEVDESLTRLGVVLASVSLGGILVAALAGLAVASAALRPVRRLSDAAEHVTETGDLTRRIEVTGEDELARLAGRFNDMLGALEGSLRSQRQLVADASHELRTPLTSLRTNIEVLATRKRIPAADRERMLADVVDQTEELTAMIADLVELAREGEQPGERAEVRLDELVEACIERTERRLGGPRFRSDLEPTTIDGDRAQLERAVLNLLDNAAKWHRGRKRIEVSLGGSELAVRDHGPGIAEEDLPHVFDRFYRAKAARGMPGSGLGLAIVKRVAEAHGATVVAENAGEGGARIRLRFSSAS